MLKIFISTSSVFIFCGGENNIRCWLYTLKKSYRNSLLYLNKVPVERPFCVNIFYFIRVSFKKLYIWEVCKSSSKVFCLVSEPI